MPAPRATPYDRVHEQDRTLAPAPRAALQEGMQTLAPWLLVSYGATLVMTGSRIAAPLRRLWPGLLACPMCFGWWIGLALGFTRWGLTGQPVLDAFASSAWCWTCHVVLARLGAEQL